MNCESELAKKTKHNLKALIVEHYPLLSILIGIVLVSISIGPFYNIDTQLEYNAALGVVRWGIPYVTTFGNLINEPPLGLYIDALFFKGIGSSTFGIGVDLITLFGLGCTVLVYKIGKALYGKPTGLLAGALFALTPWQFVLSRTFLMDVQCLFFSLIFLFVGVQAIRKDSFKLFMVSGAFFATAILTKVFAVFTLIPLALFYFRYRQKNLRRIYVVVSYFLPAIALYFLWQVIVGREIFSVFGHDDFTNFNALGVVPSYFFVGNFLLNAVGAWFLVAAVLSLLVCFLDRKSFAKTLPFDLMCLATILTVGSINTYLAVGLNLSAPYINPIKYDYQFLPFLSLLAASLLSKLVLIFNSVKLKKKINLLVSIVVLLGLGLLVVAMLFNMNNVHKISTYDYLLFQVERDRFVGYSFLNSTPTGKYSSLMAVQYLGFAFVLAGLVWASKTELDSLRNLVHRRTTSCC